MDNFIIEWIFCNLFSWNSCLVVWLLYIEYLILLNRLITHLHLKTSKMKQDLAMERKSGDSNLTSSFLSIYIPTKSNYSISDSEIIYKQNMFN
jgi:hypothetical protein